MKDSTLKAKVLDRARRTFGSEVRARRWLNRPLRVLAGRSPLEVAKSASGVREVVAVLDRLEDGIVS
jgi:putative toxin-antitoxin system antitoxin component (TIGR02293 family)